MRQTSIATNIRHIFCVLALLALSACVPNYSDEPLKPRHARSANCEPVAMPANANTEREARAIALKSLKLDATDVRGNMISSGLRRIRVTSRDMRCGPYVLAPSRVQCSASLVLCGR